MLLAKAMYVGQMPFWVLLIAWILAAVIVTAVVLTVLFVMNRRKR